MLWWILQGLLFVWFSCVSFNIDKKVSIVLFIIGLFVIICPIVKMIYGKSVKNIVNTYLALYTFLVLFFVVLLAQVVYMIPRYFIISIIVIIINIYLIIKDCLKR